MTNVTNAKQFLRLLIFAAALVQPASMASSELAINQLAPTFKLKKFSGKEFDLASRKGKWTVLYFYPKSETPGCTKQACAFRDSIDKIKALGADVFGVSVNSVEDQAKFHEHHHLKFDLLADADGEVTSLYGAKMPIMKMAKRWTFLIDPTLKIRSIDKNVDPAMDPDHVVAKLKELQSKGP